MENAFLFYNVLTDLVFDSDKPLGFMLWSRLQAALVQRPCYAVASFGLTASVSVCVMCVCVGGRAEVRALAWTAAAHSSFYLSVCVCVLSPRQPTRCSLTPMAI